MGSFEYKTTQWYWQITWLLCAKLLIFISEHSPIASSFLIIGIRFELQHEFFLRPLWCATSGWLTACLSVVVPQPQHCCSSTQCFGYFSWSLVKRKVAQSCQGKKKKKKRTGGNPKDFVVNGQCGKTCGVWWTA